MLLTDGGVAAAVLGAIERISRNSHAEKWPVLLKGLDPMPRCCR
jgi:hypothetical protein